jgi:hypothetical protein
VAAERRMHVVTFADCDPRVDEAVAVLIAQLPQRWRRSEKHLAVVIEHPAGDVGRGIHVEPLEHDLRAIRDAVAVGVFDAVQAFLQARAGCQHGESLESEEALLERLVPQTARPVGTPAPAEGAADFVARAEELPSTQRLA